MLNANPTCLWLSFSCHTCQVSCANHCLLSCYHISKLALFNCAFYLHSHASSRTHFHAVLVLHIRRCRLDAWAAWNAWANVEHIEFQILRDRALQGEEYYHSRRIFFLAGVYEAFSCFEYFFPLVVL